MGRRQADADEGSSAAGGCAPLKPPERPHPPPESCHLGEQQHKRRIVHQTRAGAGGPWKPALEDAEKERRVIKIQALVRSALTRIRVKYMVELLIADLKEKQQRAEGETALAAKNAEPERPRPPYEAYQLNEEQQQRQTFRQQRASAEIDTPPNNDPRNNNVNEEDDGESVFGLSAQPGAFNVQGMMPPSDGTIQYSMGQSSSDPRLPTSTNQQQFHDQEENLIVAELAPTPVEGVAVLVSTTTHEERHPVQPATEPAAVPGTSSWNKQMIFLSSVLIAILIGIVVIVVAVVGGSGDNDAISDAVTTTTESPTITLNTDNVDQNESDDTNPPSAERPITPENDRCENAIEMLSSGFIVGSTDDATVSSINSDDKDCELPAVDVWYSVQGTGYSITVSLCNIGTSFDTQLSIFSSLDGDCLSGFSQCLIDDDNGCGTSSELTWLTAVGATYHIRVAGFGISTGTYSLRTEIAPPAASQPTSLPTLVSSPLPTLRPTHRPTHRPTPTPTPEPTPIPTTAPTSLMDIALSMLSPFIPNLPSSAIQRQALDWLIGNDGEGLIAMQSADLLLDRYVLSILYLSTSGDGWRSTDGWLSQDTVCTWDLRICPQENGRVDRISLGANNLQGSIPTEIGAMTTLTYLHMLTNSLDGTIPTEIGMLTALRFLGLGFNNLEGTIPTEIGRLTALRFLDISDSDLVGGTIPTELGRLTALTHLELDDNNMTGTIPTELDNILASLSTCWLGGNPRLMGVPSNCRSD